MAFPEIGGKAPAFTLKNQNDETVKLSDFKGKIVVLYFYPKALTPGCTTQACGISDSIESFTSLNSVVLGVSPDDVKKVGKFTEKYNLNFGLLADADHSVAEKYGVWALKKFMGREFMGVLRTTFIIDGQGKVRHVISKVNVKTHHDEVLTLVKELT